ncbi:competence protein ComK [Aquibacillus albus]|uniref:Competence protein ComK n=1 Tax=Aquibacillus albus TaxID=1168171 RepID=A0ABS2MZS3_9BACI|nr:competence protein ComK [Aquibacillus albus]MBM7571401.1 competence protein ComK [Aquibacillus albus]
MTMILSNYSINQNTMALTSAAQIEYDTIVYERNRQLFIKKTPFQLIKQACLEAYSSYEGRRSAVMYQTNLRQKVPIPIDPVQNIYTFPTQSPSQFDCSWLFYHHIKSIHPHHLALGHAIHKSIITFKNEQQIPMRESYYQLEKQRQRTAICILQIASQQHQQLSL